ncbi:MAG: putative DNA binding domain-containing protein [Holophagales bacterium]|nr:putative DNA binding domain-containing protein [Holophagales bacterium]
MLDRSEELLRKIRLGEDTALELKAVRFRGPKVMEPKRADLADEIAAMANTAGGVVVLGVSDDREIDGLSPEQLDLAERFVYEICTDTIRPPVIFRTSRLELPDPEGELRAVLKVEVPRSLFVHQSPGGYFHRQGSSKRPLVPEVLARLFQQRSQARLIRFDEQTVPDSSPTDLLPELYRPYLGRAPRELSPEQESTDLRKLRLVWRDADGVDRATVAGLLLASREPRLFLPGATIVAVRYRGAERASGRQLDARELCGPLHEQVRDALAFVDRNMSIAAHKDPARKEIPQFDLRAVFEAVVNAVAHRDYSIHGSRIRLFVFDDRLELFSPGALPNTLSVDTLALRQSTRNELIASLLARTPVEDPTNRLERRFLMEKRGDGVPLILERSRELSGREPEYRVLDDAEVMLTIWAAAAPE